jgi:acetoin utilization deacetylase AcuC-like enzyme
VLSHPSSLQHDTGAHPERAARMQAIAAELERRDWIGYERLQSGPVSRGDLTAIHPQGYVDAIRDLCERGGGAIDADTLVSPGSWEAALHAAGGATALVDRLADGAAPAGISIARPPGHHAQAARAMGFCLFNNVAVAARRALDVHRLERVLIVDWDVHHGNGTNDLFHDTDEVLFASIHQSPLYPGTGSWHDVGSGEGEGYTVNLPVPAGSGDAVFGSLVEHVVVPLARAFEPRLILVSAGYDAHRHDPLADGQVTDEGYRTMTRSLRRVADELGVAVGVVLEGGYELGALARSVAATMEELAAPEERHAVELGVHPLATEALGRVGRLWPQLADGAATGG